MKISFVLPDVSLSGGIRVVAIYARRLQERGHEVHVVSVPPRRPTLREQFRSLRRGQGLLIARLNPSHFENVAVPHHIIDRFRPVTDADLPDADVVIATWWGTAEWVAALSPAKGAKAYFVQHHETHDYFPKERVAATYRLPLYKIVVAPWLAALLAERYDEREVSVVPNSVDPALFYAPPRDKQRRPTVGFMYSTKQWKGCDISLAAFRLAATQLPGLRLISFGETPPVEELLLPPGTHFECQPPQSALRSLYAQCDAWLFGSRLEGFGLPILEAMACRTPVIGTPAGAAPLLIRDGVGRLVAPEDPAAMAAAIVELCHLPNGAWRRMSAAALEVATRYSWDDGTDRFEAALETAVVRQRAERPLVIAAGLEREPAGSERAKPNEATTPL